jgi:hypothetical protein
MDLEHVSVPAANNCLATTRCRLYCLTNSALVYKPKCGWGGGGGWLRVPANVQLYSGAQLNFEDLTPYLTYGNVD